MSLDAFKSTPDRRDSISRTRCNNGGRDCCGLKAKTAWKVPVAWGTGFPVASRIARMRVCCCTVGVPCLANRLSMYAWAISNRRNRAGAKEWRGNKGLRTINIVFSFSFFSNEPRTLGIASLCWQLPCLCDRFRGKGGGLARKDGLGLGLKCGLEAWRFAPEWSRIPNVKKSRHLLFLGVAFLFNV